jgi:hypothetical protein
MGELPSHAYPERERFPVNAYEPGQDGSGVNAQAGVAGMVQTVRRGWFVNYSASVDTAGIKVLSENAKRCYLFIQILSTSPAGLLYVNYGNEAVAGLVELTSPGGTYEFPVVPVNSIWLKASAGTMIVVVTEGTER